MLLLSPPWKALAKNSTRLRYQSKAASACGAATFQRPRFCGPGGPCSGHPLTVAGINHQALSGWSMEHPKRLCQGVSFGQAGPLLTTSEITSPEMARHRGTLGVLVSVVVPSTECQWASRVQMGQDPIWPRDLTSAPNQKGGGGPSRECRPCPSVPGPCGQLLR